MVAPRLGYVISLNPEPTGLLFQLLETIDRDDDHEIKGVIQKSIVDVLRMDVLKSIGAQYDRSVYDNYAIKAAASVRKKVYKEEAAQAIKKMTEFSKKIDKAIREWQEQVKHSEDEETEEREAQGSRKRKLVEIEDKAEELLNFSKRLKEK